MKRVSTFSLSYDVIRILKAKSSESGLPMTAMIEMLVTDVLQGMTREDLKAKFPEIVVDLGDIPIPKAKRTKWELTVWTAFETLGLEAEDGRRTFLLREIARKGGLYPSEALKGLRALEQRGELMSVVFDGKEEWQIPPLHLKGKTPAQIAEWQNRMAEIMDKR